MIGRDLLPFLAVKQAGTHHKPPPSEILVGGASEGFQPSVVAPHAVRGDWTLIWWENGLAAFPGPVRPPETALRPDFGLGRSRRVQRGWSGSRKDGVCPKEILVGGASEGFQPSVVAPHAVRGDWTPPAPRSYCF
eukprot:CAMPEP_0173414708 /NCGR_PEP_ID=MMETSP1356-20130122/84470_1 /TAXON_ID=77927 ORGANISM="Hemiselmis virescens, Strain PCC157" /NCGR_SAMPLE_ID=MMETSP1356 /ASSEMBLY_ACC=CAM_ASM_000847 /LENGTH=134 /DNA_ID=CAMNT_0014376911 /DNA_START=1456 /DNA_END=1861 /DNA_ORIENTATION=-